MRCPECGCERTRVLESRDRDNCYSIMRRRKCLSCGNMFKTTEVASAEKKRVGKTIDSPRGIAFEPKKILLSIIIADSDSEIPVKDVNDFVTGFLIENKEKYTKKEIIRRIAEFLKEKSYTAYVRYLCKYQNFILDETSNSNEEGEET